MAKRQKAGLKGLQKVEKPVLLNSKPKAIAVAVSLALVPAVGMAEFKKNIELYAVPTNDSRTLVGVAGLVPFSQTGDSLLYGDFRFTHSTADTNEFNIMLGKRFLKSDGSWILGGYLAYDRRRSQTGRNYNQIGVGFEALSDKYDFRANYYHPTTDKTFLGYGAGSYAGNNLTVHKLYEEALQGLDLEVGFNPNLINGMETRFYLGAYHFKGDVTDGATGLRLRAELKPMQNITIGASVEDDDIFGSKAMLEFRYSFGYPNKRARRTLSERMTEFSRRDIDIRETSGLPETVAAGPAEDGLDLLGYNSGMIHIDNSNTGGDGGDGTAENPYESIDNCYSGTNGGISCDTADTLVYVHYGDGTDFQTDIGFDMPTNQAIIGEGVDFYGLGTPGMFPMISNGDGPTINLNDDARVAGLYLYNYNYDAVFGDNAVQNVNIHDNRIVTEVDGDGINLEGVEGSINIARNDIDAFDDAIELNLYGDEGGKYAQSAEISITDNMLDSQDDDGIDIGLYGDPGYLPVLSGTISGNMIDADEDGVDVDVKYGSAVLTISNNEIDAGDTGIWLGAEGAASTLTATVNDNMVTDGGMLVAGYNGATQVVNASGNTFTGEGSEGSESPLVTIYGYGGDNALSQTVNLNNNTLTPDKYGSALLTVAGSEGAAAPVTQTVSLTGNTVTVDGPEGAIAAGAWAEDGGIVNQTLNMTDNTLTGNIDADGVEGGIYSGGVMALNAAKYGASTQTLNLTGNTIDVVTVDGPEGNSAAAVNTWNYVEDNGVATQNVNLTDNMLTSTGSAARMVNFAGVEGSDSGLASQNLVASGNTFTSGYDAWETLGVWNLGGGDATATQSVTLNDNQLMAEGSEGALLLGINTFGSYGADTGSGLSNQNLIMDGNTIDQEGGAIILNGAEGGTSTQVATLSNNNFGDYLGIGNDAENGDENPAYPGNAIQTVDLSGGGNSVGDGTGIWNEDDSAGVAIQNVNLVGPGNSLSPVTCDGDATQIINGSCDGAEGAPP